MKKVLGLDIGTNSIGAALVNLPLKFEDYGKDGSIEWMGSRIVPTDGDYLKKFEEGQTSGVETKAASRRGKRGARRLKHRYKLRRSRLVKVFKALGWLDENFPLDDSKSFKKHAREDENFKFSINSYLPFSENTIQEFKEEMGINDKKRFDKKKNKEVDFLLPEDWIIYYLRKKALTKKIEIPELVRIIYMMNQRRGFKSSRKDLKDSVVLPYEDFIIKKENKEYGENGIETQFVSITKIKSVTFKEEKKDKKGNAVNIYTIIADDARMESWEETRKNQPEWEGKEVTFLVVQKIDKNGKFSQNKPQIPKEDNWALCTTALDEKINEQIYPGKYFFDELKKAFNKKTNFKIRQYPVYRWRYKKELEDIWEKQSELNPELRKINTDTNILIHLAEILYPTQAKNKMSKLAEFKSKDLLHIISNDIIYYQRELKSQKNSINECRYEKRKGIDGETYGLKCIPRSSPLFQEFRIWQDIHNIRILQREVKENSKTRLDVDVSENFIDEKMKERLFETFNKKSTVSEGEILKLIKDNYPDSNIQLDIDKKEKIHSHRVNLFANRDELKGNEILSRYRNLFKKAEFDVEDILLNNDKLIKLWHIDYSITSSDEEKSKKGITTALNKLLEDKQNKDKLIELFCKLPELKKEYGSYSAMAIKKMLPVMRCGKYWEPIETLIDLLENQKNITRKSKQLKESNNYLKTLRSINPRASQILERLNDINHNVRRLGEIADDDVQKQVLKSFIGKEDLTKGLGTYQAGYLIYDRHSEKNKILINSVEEFGKYIQKEIPNNSLRNPIVEKIVRETMFLVRDIWKHYGEINEIHIELGRDLKNNADERKKIADVQKNNFDEKQHIKQLLYELLNEGFDQYIDAADSKLFDWKTEIESAKVFEVKPNPESPIDIDKFRIWRSLSKNTDADWDKKVKDEKIPTEQQIKKYALWLSQNCRSPYTGKIIPLSKLFDITQYEIEHIIPRKKLKNESFNNLVIAEWGVNKAKDNQLAANFIANCKGKCTYGNIEYSLFTYDEYDAYCGETFKFQKAKRKNLLATEVPEDFIQRQINDTRYIGRKLTELLSPIAINDDGSLNENGIVFTIGSITSELKTNWGLNSVWKEIIRPRFERLEKKTGNQYIIHDKDEFGNPIIHYNVKENQKLNTKRIDHRHHALDALIVAATTREHIRYLNTLNAADTDEEFRRFRMTLVKDKIREFKQPWDNFTRCAKDKLQETIVTFKTNTNIISQPKNKYTKWFTENDKQIKKLFEQKPNPHWMAVRRSMFKEPQGIIYLKEIYEEKSIIKAIEIQINRMQVQNTPAMRLAPYVYDKETRQIIRNLIEQIGISIDEKLALLTTLKKHLRKNSLKSFAGTVYRSIRIAEFKEYAAKRVNLDSSFDHKKINKIPYSHSSIIPVKIHEHLLKYHAKKTGLELVTVFNDNLNINEKKEREKLESIIKESAKEAFSNEGLEILAKEIGTPIKKVTIVEEKSSENKFGKQYVEVDAGAMSYFVMYENRITKERKYLEPSPSIPTHKAIERLTDKTKQGIADEKEGYNLIILSPGDLVYVPTIEESKKIKQGSDIKEVIEWNNKKKVSDRIYSVTRFSKKQCYFLKSTISDLIIPYDSEKKIGEYGSQNYSERSDDDIKIVEVCIKLNVNRLGNIIPAKTNNYNQPPTETSNILSEPETAYQKPNLQTFNSFEEANEADAKSMAALSPEQHLQNATTMIRKIYAEQLSKPMNKNLKF